MRKTATEAGKQGAARVFWTGLPRSSTRTRHASRMAQASRTATCHARSDLLLLLPFQQVCLAVYLRSRLDETRRVQPPPPHLPPHHLLPFAACVRDVMHAGLRERGEQTPNRRSVAQFCPSLALLFVSQRSVYDWTSRYTACLIEDRPGMTRTLGHLPLVGAIRCGAACVSAVPTSQGLIVRTPVDSRGDTTCAA